MLKTWTYQETLAYVYAVLILSHVCLPVKAEVIEYVYIHLYKARNPKGYAYKLHNSSKFVP